MNQKRKIFPNVVIAGAPKSGTSSLFFWMSSHPDVCGSKVKETFYLADEDNRFNNGYSYRSNGLDGYAKFFNHYSEEKIVLEATAPYIYYKTPIEVLSQLDPKPIIIFILREPAAKIYSQYKFNRYKLKTINCSFAEYVDKKGSQFNGNRIDHGYYADWIKKWVDAFGLEHIEVYALENLIKDKKQFMKRIAEKLEIDPLFYDEFDFFKRNETYGVKSKWFHRFGLKLQQYVPYSIQELLIPIYQKVNGKVIPGKSTEEIELINELKDWYSQRNGWLYSNFPDSGLKEVWEKT